MRRGGPIAINRHDRFPRRTWRNPLCRRGGSHKPLGLTETELPKSRRRHSSIISMRQIRPCLLRFLRESVHDPDNRCDLRHLRLIALHDSLTTATDHLPHEHPMRLLFASIHSDLDMRSSCGFTRISRRCATNQAGSRLT